MSDLEKLRLVYVGKASLMHVPARNLTEMDMILFELNEADLIKSGLYKKPETHKPAPKKSKAGKESE